MEITDKLDELYMKIYKQQITQEDMILLKSALTSTCPEHIVIKRFTKGDSIKLYSTIVISIVTKIIFKSAKSDLFQTDIGKEIILVLYDFLFKEQSFEDSLCYLEYSRLKTETNKIIIEILSIIKNEKLEEKMKYFLAKKDDRDIFGANFALILEITEKISNRECKILNSKKLDVEFLEVLCNTKNCISKENLKIIFNLTKNKLLKNTTKRRDNKHEILTLLAIISEINTNIKEKSIEVLNFVPELITETYLGFLYSLMVDNESIEKVWGILNEYNLVHEIISRLKQVRELLHEENIDAFNEDIYFIKYGVLIITVIISTIKETKSFFITHCDSFLNLLWSKLPNDVLAVFFKYCTLLICDEEIQVKVYEYFLHLEIFNRFKRDEIKTKNRHELFYYNQKTLYDIFDEEFKTDEYVLTTQAVILCSKLLNYGIFENEIFEFYNVAIKSSNSEILMTILQKMVDKKHPISVSTISNIKLAIEKNIDICDTFLNFCIINGQNGYMNDVFRFTADNINLMYLIFTSKSDHFFRFIRKINSREILVFIGDDFLNRISDSPEEGLNYLIDVCEDNLDLCTFIIKRSSFFNNLSGYDILKLKLYNIVSSINWEDFDIILEKNIDTNDKFYLPEIHTNEYFYIISRIIQREYYESDKYKSYIINNYKYSEDNLSGYCKYIKTLITVDINVEKDIKKLINLNIEHENIAELVGFYRIVKNSTIKYNFTPKKLLNIILNKIGSFDNDFFFRKFDRASSYEKFLLFFLLDPKEMNDDIFKLIKKEINILVANNPFSVENEALLIHCLNFMTYSKNVDQVIKNFGGTEIPDKFVDLLARINFVNLVHKGKEMLSVKLIKRASIDLQVKICVLSFFHKSLSNEILRDLVFSLRKSVVDENLEFVYKEMQRING